MSIGAMFVGWARFRPSAPGDLSRDVAGAGDRGSAAGRHRADRTDRHGFASDSLARRLLAVVLFAGAAEYVAAATSSHSGTSRTLPPLPLSLRETGLFVDGSVSQVRAENRLFSPQYPLWSDGAAKRRWIHLPSGTVIDGSSPDDWKFPRGVRFWKEFSHQGRPVETRYLERLGDGNWRYATYVWTADGSDAFLAPSAGLSLSTPRAPAGRYVVPSEDDCRACHEGVAEPVLGFSALQLARQSPASEPAQSGSIDLRELIERGLLRGFPRALAADPSGIVARSPLERAALGYLHANCGHCHRSGEFGVPVGLALAQTFAPGSDGEAGWRKAIGAPSRYRVPGAADALLVIAPGAADASVLALRMRSRDPQVQMPPLGTQVADEHGLSLIEEWIDTMSATMEVAQ